VQTVLQLKHNNYYIIWFCICSLKYPAFNARAPYCHVAWPALL